MSLCNGQACVMKDDRNSLLQAQLVNESLMASDQPLPQVVSG